MMAYDLEKYAEALEGLANMEPRPYNLGLNMVGALKETPEEYATYIHHHISTSRAFKAAAWILSAPPDVLWATYPDYFPDPDAKEDTDG